MPLIALAKVARRWSDWQTRANHAGHLIGIAELATPDGISIPGLTIELEVKADITARACLYLFSIMKLRGKDRVPVYQLEVASRQKRTHNGLTTIYGPHEHIGSAEPTPVDDSKVDCSSWHEALLWFSQRVNTTGLNAPDPFTP